jgi:hypothetical protein
LYERMGMVPAGGVVGGERGGSGQSWVVVGVRVAAQPGARSGMQTMRLKQRR